MTALRFLASIPFRLCSAALGAVGVALVALSLGFALAAERIDS